MDAAVALVKTYLELCGYFVLAELPVRAADDHGYHDVTDLDVIGSAFRIRRAPPAAPGHRLTCSSGSTRAWPRSWTVWTW